MLTWLPLGLSVSPSVESSKSDSKLMFGSVIIRRDRRKDQYVSQEGSERVDSMG